MVRQHKLNNSDDKFTYTFVFHILGLKNKKLLEVFKAGVVLNKTTVIGYIFVFFRLWMTDIFTPKHTHPHPHKQTHPPTHTHTHPHTHTHTVTSL